MLEEDIEIFYRTFVEHLNTGDQCVLILGPELSVNEEGVGYKKYFKKLVKDDENAMYFPAENLFHFNNDRQLEYRKVDEIKKFYGGFGDQVLLESIARIRFPLIINVCPDDNLYKLLDKKGEKNIRSEFFSAKNLEDDRLNQLEKEPSVENPIIYNMFGVVNRPQTMVYTYRDLFNTIEHMIPEGSLPDHIERYIKHADSFLFLGFTFDSWYYQLVCHKLQIFDNSGRSKPTLTASCNSLFNHVISNHFGMMFTDETPSQSISRITSLCIENGYNHLLRDTISFDSLSLFISYSWGDDGLNPNHSSIIPIIKSYFIENGKSIQLLLDRDKVTYGDSIDSFMTRIGQGKSVIRVVSDKYLKSTYAMTEALRISKYRERLNLDDCPSRIHNIIWNNIDYDVTVYKNFWKNRISEIWNSINQNLEDVIDLVQARNKELESYAEIYSFLEPFHSLIKDDVGLKLSEEDFIRENEKLKLTSQKQKEFEKFMEVIESSMKKNC